MIGRLTRWWDSLAPIQQLLLFGGYVLAIWVALYFHDSGRHDPLDLAILFGITGTYSLACLVMVWGTGRWSLRALGILGTLSGDAVLYSLFGASAAHWLRPIPEGLTDITRALFIAGGPLLVIGIALYVRDRHNGEEA